MQQDRQRESMAELNEDLEGRLLTYRPLDQARREIRLVELRVELQAASNGKQVPLLRLYQAFLGTEDLPEYTALSYTWGTAPNSIVLVEDEKKPAREVLVSANLADALYHFGGLHRPRFEALDGIVEPSWELLYWIDQLCINQNDNDEKSHQVKMMMDIFGQAKTTDVWLGSREAPLNLEVMKKFTQNIRHIKGAIANEDIFLQDIRSDDSILSQQVDGILRECGEDNYKELFALTTFCTHPWFGRAWVVQEIATSSNIQIHWESGSSAWSDIVLLYWMFIWLSIRINETKGSYPGIVLSRLGQAMKMLTMTVNQSFRRPGTQTLIQVIAKMLVSGYMRATKPEDLVHSMMGISSDGGTCGIEVDYGKHYTEVFREMALLLLKTLGARALAWSGQRRRKSDPSGCRLPSWVPDLRLDAAKVIHEDIGSINPLLAPKLFSAAGNCRFEFTADSKSEILSIRTSYVDRTLGLGKPFGIFRGHDATSDFLLQSQAWLKYFGGFFDAAAERHPKRYDYTTRQEMYWRMPIADRYFDEGHWRRAGLEAKDLDMATLHPDDSISAAVISKTLTYRNSFYVDGQIAFVTETGYVGIGRPETVVGDEVHLVQGSDTPFVLRKTDGHYELIGETYVHGIMDGELVDDNTEFEWVQIH